VGMGNSVMPRVEAPARETSVIRMANPAPMTSRLRSVARPAEVDGPDRVLRIMPPPLSVPPNEGRLSIPPPRVSMARWHRGSAWSRRQPHLPLPGHALAGRLRPHPRPGRRELVDDDSARMREENKALIRRVEEAWSAGYFDLLGELFDPSMVSHAAVPYLPPGLQGWIKAHRQMTHAVPDRRGSTED